jgi:tetratricopeptide (TPR) repeat protein
MALYEEMEQLAQERADRPFQLAALIAKTTLHIVFTPLHDSARGEKMIREALSLAAELNDKAAEISIERGLINLYRYSGRMPQAIASAERTVALLRPLNMPEQLAFALYESAHCYFFDGRFPAAITTIQEAIALWRTTNNLPMLADGVATAAIIHTYSGHYDQATALADEALTISQTINNVWGQTFAQQAVGLVPWQQGRPDKAIATMEQSIELSKQAGLAMPQVLTRSDLAVVYGSLGAMAEGLALAHQAVTTAMEQLPNLRAFQSYALLNLARLQLQAADLVAAEGTLQQAKQVRLGDGRFFTLLIDIVQSYLTLVQGDYDQTISLTQTALTKAQAFGTRAYTPTLLLRQAQALQASGQPTLAYKRLQEAKVAAEVLGSKHLLWQILLALSELERDGGTTAVYHQEAQTIIHFIANHAPPELRDSFLGLPDVKAVFKKGSRGAGVLGG